MFEPFLALVRNQKNALLIFKIWIFLKKVQTAVQVWSYQSSFQTYQSAENSKLDLKLWNMLSLLSPLLRPDQQKRVLCFRDCQIWNELWICHFVFANLVFMVFKFGGLIDKSWTIHKAMIELLNLRFSRRSVCWF